MSRPIQEPTQPRELAGHGWRVDQLERRPAPPGPRPAWCVASFVLQVPADAALHWLLDGQCCGFSLTGPAIGTYYDVAVVDSGDPDHFSISAVLIDPTGDNTGCDQYVQLEAGSYTADLTNPDVPSLIAWNTTNEIQVEVAGNAIQKKFGVETFQNIGTEWSPYAIATPVANWSYVFIKDTGLWITVRARNLGGTDCVIYGQLFFNRLLPTICGEV